MTKGNTPDTKVSLVAGDTFLDKGDDYWTSGIDVGEHGNCIECYGRTESEAVALRDRVLAALEHSPPSNPAIAPLVEALERETEAIKALRKVSAGKFDAAQNTVWNGLWGRHGELQRAVRAARPEGNVRAALEAFAKTAVMDEYTHRVSVDEWVLSKARAALTQSKAIEPSEDEVETLELRNAAREAELEACFSRIAELESQVAALSSLPPSSEAVTATTLTKEG